MDKIPTLFVRGDDFLVTPEINHDCQWVLDGEGVASEKFDGTCCLVKDGVLYRRLKEGSSLYRRASDGSMAETVGDSSFAWTPVGDGPQDRYHREAFQSGEFANGTYELVGPKINGNPDLFPTHALIPHGAVTRSKAPRDYLGLRKWLSRHCLEGLVWKHPDGRMAKLKVRDFGLKRRGVQA